MDVHVDDLCGKRTECMMVAGHVAYSLSRNKPDGPLDTLAPSPQWFMFIKRDEDPVEERLSGHVSARGNASRLL